VNGEKIPANKPMHVKHGDVLSVGPEKYSVHAAQPTDEFQAASSVPQKVRASHLLVKHSGSRRPSSWKQATITRSPEEALKMIEECRNRIVQGHIEFGELASVESDCSSAKRLGDLGDFGPGEMQKEFEDATYSLQVGELSGPVHTASGIHLILRTA